MCTKPEQAEFYRPIADLINEFIAYEAGVQDFAWAGVRSFYGLLENA